MRRVPHAMRLAPAERALFGAFALISLWVLALDLWRSITDGLVWTGTDGSFVRDQLQYLSWIQSASRHVLVANLFVLHPTPADYFQPAVAISGRLVALGISPQLALLLWKPVGVIWLFMAVRAYAHRVLPDAGRGAWLAVIALTLFYGSFTDVSGSFGVLVDLFPGFWAWGYPFALISLAALTGALVRYDAARRSGAFTWTPALLGALAGIMHPWQGELLLVTLALAELLSIDTRAALRRVRSSRQLRAQLLAPRVRLAVATMAGTLVPLLYYAALARLDTSWKLGRIASKHALPALAIGLAVAPLAVVALSGYRGRAPSFLLHATRLWPAAAVIIFLQAGSSAGATPLHTFFGITLPLSVLAVDGCRRWLTRPVLVVPLILLLTVPATLFELREAAQNASPATRNANFITDGEARALRYLRRDPAAGGVLTRFYLGPAVPALTGRRTYVGDCIWSEPDCGERKLLARRLLFGQMSPATARRFVSSMGARFVLSDCTADADLTRALGPLIASARRFGCATVYELRASGTSGSRAPN